MIELDLSFTSVNALPSSFGRQRNLKSLRLAHSGIESLPPSFKNLTRLRFLSLYNSTQLRTLAELPPSLETLWAPNCRSLKTVLFPSIAEQFKESRRYVALWNCLKLEEHSLKAIGINAHINMMKYAYQHLSAPDESYDHHNRSYRSYPVKYVYPGSRVPEWLDYKTTKDYIIINLSSTTHSSELGFIFGFVIPRTKVEKLFVSRYSFYFSISDEDESKDNSIDIYTHRQFGSIDHVCVIYDERCSHYLDRKAKNLTKLKIKVKAISSGEAHGFSLRGFGVKLVNASAYHNFVQQINTSEDHNSIQHINNSSDQSFIQQMNVSHAMYFIHMLAIILCVFILWLRCRLSRPDSRQNAKKYVKKDWSKKID